MCVGFWYTSMERDPLLRVIKVSKNESFPSSSCSVVNLICGSMELISCEEVSFGVCNLSTFWCM